MNLQSLSEIVMGPEGPYFGAAIGGRDAAARERYRRWLAERGDERAELFAIEDVLLRDDFAEREATIARAREILSKSASLREWWRLVTRSSPIRNCGSAGAVRRRVRFAFECPRTWEALAPTGDPSVRRCDGCEQLVYLCRTRDEAEERARRGECITVTASSWNMISSEVTGSCTGRPDPVAMWADRVFPDERHDESRVLRMSIVLAVEPQWVSPWVFACFVTLREKKLAFDVRELHTSNGDTKTTDYLDRTITGRVPSLVHEDFAVAESSAIIEYLEETFPEIAVLPRMPRERARCRQLMSWLRSDETLPLRKERSTHTMFFESQRAKTPLSEDARASSEKLCAVTSRVLRESPSERWNIVHSELAFILHRLILNGDPCPDDVRAWATEQWKRPTVREFVERERKA